MNDYRTSGHAAWRWLHGAGPARALLRVALFGLLYYLLASPLANLNYGQTLASIVWPAPAVAIALLWRVPARRWPAYLAAILLAMLLAGAPGPSPWLVDIEFALLNVAEVAFSVWLGRRYVSASGELATLAQLARFLLLLPLAATALTAALGATIALAAQPWQPLLHWLYEWRAILIGNGLAVLIVVPAMLSWRVPRGAYPLTALAALLSALALTLLALALDWSAEVLRVLLSLVLAWAAIHGGLRAASLAAIAATVAGVVPTMFGLGPYGAMLTGGVWRLQADLAGLALLSFFIAVVVRERRELAQRLERAHRLESLGLLASGVAHDFNNVLAAVGGYVELATERLGGSSPARSALHEVTAAVARGRDMTEQILLAARRGDRQRTHIDLREIVTEAASLARPLCPAGVNLDLQLPARAVPVWGHRSQLIRAALNLMRNASQAAATRVVVTLGRGDSDPADPVVGQMPAGAAAWLDVADDGPGLAGLDLPRLFEPFFSGPHRYRHGVANGSGLGLAIVAGVALEHAGGVQAASNAAGGSHFRLVLPLAQSTALPSAAAAPATAAAPPLLPFGRGERVLVLAAAAPRRTQIEDWLAELGFEPLGYADDAAIEVEFGVDPPVAAVLVWQARSGSASEPQAALLSAVDALLARLRQRAPRLPLLVSAPLADALPPRAGVHWLAPDFAGAALAGALRAAWEPPQ